MLPSVHLLIQHHPAATTQLLPEHLLISHMQWSAPVDKPHAMVMLASSREAHTHGDRDRQRMRMSMRDLEILSSETDRKT